MELYSLVADRPVFRTSSSDETNNVRFFSPLVFFLTPLEVVLVFITKVESLFSITNEESKLFGRYQSVIFDNMLWF